MLERMGITPTERSLPADLNAERATLGSIMLERDAIIVIAPWLLPDYFYLEKHAWIYEAMLTSYNRRIPPDLSTVADELRRQERLDLVGGLMYLGELTESVPTAVHVEYYARIIERTAILRRLIEAGGKIAALGYDEREDLEATLDKAEGELFAISQRRIQQDFLHVRTIIDAYFDQINRTDATRGEMVGIPTGYVDMDRLTGGFQRSDLIILAARPSVGKCLSAHTLIDDPATGERLTIEECVRRRLLMVYGLSAQGRLRATAISAWIDSGVQPCYRVQTALGRVVEVTGHHPFLTRTGWRALQELRTGDEIGVPWAVPLFGRDESWPLELVRLLACILAAGTVTETELHFVSTDDAMVADFKAILAVHFGTCVVQQDADRCIVTSQHSPDEDSLFAHPLIVWLRELGLIRNNADAHFFPACVWRWSRRYLSVFLRSFVGCSGVINTVSPERSQIECSFATPQLAADLQHALVRFGIIAWYYCSIDGSYRVDIAAPDAVRTYQQQIGWPDAEEATLLTEIRVPETRNADVYWDSIAAIDYIGEQQVYDLTVPDGANFVAQDVLVHNTALALSLAYNMAVKSQHTVAIFSLEMSREQLVQRLLAMHTGIDTQRLRTGNIGRDLDTIIQALGVLSEAEVYIEDTPALSITEVRSRARRLRSQTNLDMVIVDYLQLMQARRSDNRVQEVSEVSRGLKALARELDVPVLALSQLSRAVEGRVSRVPMLSDLRESGSLEQDADVVMFIYREELYDKETDKKGIAEIHIAKHRNGPTGVVPLRFETRTTTFQNLVRYTPTEGY